MRRGQGGAALALDCRSFPGWGCVTVLLCVFCVGWWVGVARLRRGRASLLRGWAARGWRPCQYAVLVYTQACTVGILVHTG